MGMSTHVIGFRAADEKWKKMKAAYNSCQKAGIPIPREVSEFFNWGDPNNLSGIEVKLGEALKPWQTDGCEGYEVDVTKLPPNLKILRFYNSY